LAHPVFRAYLYQVHVVFAGAQDATDSEELATLGDTRRNDIRQLEATSSSETTRRREAHEDTEQPLHVTPAVHARTSPLDVDCPLNDDIEVRNVTMSLEHATQYTVSPFDRVDISTDYCTTERRLFLEAKSSSPEFSHSPKRSALKRGTPSRY